ncbi:serine protease [Chamaesiphon sp. OTE_20_metabat_361]|uniref:S1 family peptidase n=1 Tax=Chamaesiphon sp. OTE_20_metabat_361 TaxID=2964689 RepID=UPI00286C8118|nr:serine protease [Chamaesiphon sp. OTE_20_metabat_361]
MPPDSASPPLHERLGDPPWHYWIARVVPMLYVTILTLMLPTILTQSFVVSDLGVNQDRRLQQHLRAISIKVLAHGEHIGSGVLLARQQQVYTAITNAHVIQATNAPFQLQTHDGQVYAAALVTPPSGQNRDLSILRFQSHDRTYTTAKLATASPRIGDRIWSAGFPSENGDPVEDRQSGATKVNLGLHIINAQIVQILPIAIAGGYSIGFDGSIRKGMSGGPSIDRSGELIGINGVHAHPLWNTPEMLENGTIASEALQQQINDYSWAIPIEFVKSYTRE